ncbi:hypothetical protein NOGI109294_06600 [Nocardiopsis gilva]
MRLASSGRRPGPPRVAQCLVGGSRLEAENAQVGRDPQLEPVGHQPDTDSEDHNGCAETGEGEAEQGAMATRPVRADHRVLSRGVGRPRRGPVHRHDGGGLADASVQQQEPGRLREPAVEQDEQGPGGRPDQPQHPPGVLRDELGRQPAGERVGERRSTADEHHHPPPMTRRDGLGQQGEGDGQHASGRHPHERAHHQVPRERGHGPAPGRAHEQHARQENGRASADPVGHRAPKQRSDHGSDQSAEREQGHGKPAFGVER